MNKLTIIERSSIWSSGMTPSWTESATALATAVWAGPNIWAACGMFLTVTFGTISVAGFVIRFGLMTERSGVCPMESCVNPFANACPTGPVFSPMIKSI
ncbi:Uncharacterised protein [uncultured archaeon]|nr:Uncharacterised protein [uncultured archaeon]